MGERVVLGQTKVFLELRFWILKPEQGTHLSLLMVQGH